MGISRYRVIADNTIVQLFARFVSSGTMFIISIYLAKILGAEGFGDFSKIITYVPFFYLLVDLGLNASYLRINKEKETVTWQELLGLRLTIAFLAIALCLALLFFLPTGQNQGYTTLVRWGILIYSFSILSHAVITTTNAQFQKLLRYDRGAIALTIGSLFTLASVFFLSNSVLWAVSLLGIGTFGTALLSLLLVKKFTSPLPVWHLRHFAYLLRDAAPLSITLFFNLLYFRIDSIILTLSRSTVEVGAYNLAFKIFEFPLVIPVFFMNSLYPLMLRDAKQPKQFQSTVSQAAFILCSLGFIASLGTWFISPILTYINPAFVNAVSLLRLLSVAFPIFFLSNLVMWTLIAKGKNKSLTLIYGVAAVLNITFNLLFIPTYGPQAAALITVVAEVLVLIAGVLSLRSFRN